MAPNKQAPVESIDDYIARQPPQVQDRLEQMRDACRKAAPDAEERIGYQMPAFFQTRYLVYFAAAKQHIGFYPTPSAIEKFKKELAIYKGAKGSVQFPLDKPLPLGLIAKIVKFRVQETQANAKPVAIKKKK